jgi:hypothetical protein
MRRKFTLGAKLFLFALVLGFIASVTGIWLSL